MNERELVQHCISAFKAEFRLLLICLGEVKTFEDLKDLQAELEVMANNLKQDINDMESYERVRHLIEKDTKKE